MEVSGGAITVETVILTDCDTFENFRKTWIYEHICKSASPSVGRGLCMQDAPKFTLH